MPYPIRCSKNFVPLQTPGFLKSFRNPRDALPNSPFKNFCTPANAVSLFENRYFLSHRPPMKFMKISPNKWVRAARKFFNISIKWLTCKIKKKQWSVVEISSRISTKKRVAGPINFPNSYSILNKLARAARKIFKYTIDFSAFFLWNS